MHNLECNTVENKTENLTLKIIVTSDVHGAIFPYDFIEDTVSTSSLAQVFTYVKEQRANQNQEVILLDNGDILQGQPVVYFSNFEKHDTDHICSQVMNYMGYDACTVGNHDIEAGHEVYDKLMREFNFPLLAANAINLKTKEPYFQSYKIINKKGIKIAILGLITPAIPNWLPEKNWEGIEFDDMVESARKWVKYIKEKEKPDAIIGLFHAGIDFTYNNQTIDTYKNENAAKIVAEQVSGFDAIFAGHDHQEYNLVVKNPDGNDVIILDPRSSAKMVAVVTINFEWEGGIRKYKKHSNGLIIEMDHCEPDAAFIAKFNNYYLSAKEYVSKPIGSFNRTVSSRDALFGNSAFVDIIHNVQLEITKADLSFASPLTYDSKILKGKVAIRDMFKLYKFENLLYVMELSGQEILDYLEFSYSTWFNQMQNMNDHLLHFILDEKGYERLGGKFYNFSSAAGIIYTVDVTKAFRERISIISMTNGEPFLLDKIYKVAINSYRGNGGGGHLMDGCKIPQDSLKNRIIWSSDKDLRYMIMKWVEGRDVVVPQANGNWKIIPVEWWRKGRKRDYQQLYDNNNY